MLAWKKKERCECIRSRHKLAWSQTRLFKVPRPAPSSSRNLDFRGKLEACGVKLQKTEAWQNEAARVIASGQAGMLAWSHNQVLRASREDLLGCSNLRGTMTNRKMTISASTKTKTSHAGGIGDESKLQMEGRASSEVYTVGGRTWPLRLEGAGLGEQGGGTSSIRSFCFWKHRFTLSSGCCVLSSCFWFLTLTLHCQLWQK